MKRFASVINTSALAAALIGAGTAAQAQSTMSLVPISPLNNFYQAGDVINVAVVLTLGTSSFASFGVPTAVGYLNSQFNDPDPNVPDYSADTTAKFSGPKAGTAGGTAMYTLWITNSPSINASTTGKISGETVQSAQALPGHSNTVVKINGVSTTLSIPAGTYTLATFAFTVASSYYSSSLTLYLTIPNGFSSAANDTDGWFSGGSPTNSINGRSAAGIPIQELLSFPAAGSRLTYNVSTASIYGFINLGLAPNAPPQPITFVYTSKTTHIARTVTIPIRTGTSFNINVAPDTYDVTLQGSKWLKKLHSNVVAITPTDYGFINETLIGGDANGDNSVDATDFGIFVSAYNSDSSVPGSGYDIQADFNCDGMVDATDFGILVSSYNQTGAM